jgi:hypothetical protein
MRKIKAAIAASEMPLLKMVPTAGLEPARLAPLPPQDSVSTNSTTSAKSTQTE